MEAFSFTHSSQVNPARVLKHVYISSIDPARNRSLLESLGITHVLDVSSTPNFVDYAKLGIRLKAFEINDNEDSPIVALFSEAFEFIDSAVDGAVLVHCKAGQSRSPTLVIAYLMARYNMTLRDAHVYVKTRKPNVAPNIGFMKQLIGFEASLGFAPSFDLGEHLANELEELFPNLPRDLLLSTIVKNNHNMIQAFRELRQR